MCRFAVFLAFDMAFLAFGFAVLAAQFEIRALMVEGLCIELGELGVAASMLGMTLAAVGNRFELAVEPQTLAKIAADVLVALDAQRVLPGAFETDMARLAVMLDLGMVLDQRSGHQHRFDRLRRRRSTEKEQDKQRQAAPETQHDPVPLGKYWLSWKAGQYA
jgi:hypothetical protein